MSVTLNGTERCNLFSYIQNNAAISLAIWENTSIVQTKVDRKIVRGVLSRKEVEFNLLGANLPNDFISLSIVLSLVTAAERKKSAGGHTVMRMPLPNNVDLLYDGKKYKCPIIVSTQHEQFNEGGYGISIGIELEDRRKLCSVEMSIFYVYHFKNSLQKAMNWIKPEQGIEIFDEY